MTRSLLPYFLFLALWLAGGSYLFHSSCAHCDAATPIGDAIPIPVSVEKEGPISSKGSALSSIDLNKVVFKSSSFHLSEEVTAYLDSYLAAYAENKSGQYLQIEGAYLKNELNSSQYPDLGLARAIKAKNYLANKGGLDRSLFSISSKKYKGAKNKGQLSIKTLDTELEKLDFKHLKDKAISLYFENEDLKLTALQKEQLFQISRYLDQHKIGVLMVEGHTDSSREWGKSMNAANQKALFVTELLIENGIPEERISTIAYGPDRPLESNKTKEGRAKNNRVALALKGIK